MKTPFRIAISLLLHLSHSLPHPLNTTTPLAPREAPPPDPPPFLTPFICRGLRLSWAMQLPAPLASSFLTPIHSPFATSSFRDLLFHWGYSEVPVVGHLCDFEGTHGLGTAFRALGVDPRSEREGGPNRCFHVVHAYVDEGDGRAVGTQGDWVDGVRYAVGFPSVLFLSFCFVSFRLCLRLSRALLAVACVDADRWQMTGAHYSIGINPIAGVVYFLNRRSAQEAAKLYWGRAASHEELPALRSSSDIAWGFWSRERWGGVEGIKAFMSLMVVNVDTRRIVDEVLRVRYGEINEGVLPWPGTTFDVDNVEGQALLGMLGPSGERIG